MNTAHLSRGFPFRFVYLDKDGDGEVPSACSACHQNGDDFGDGAGGMGFTWVYHINIMSI